MKKAFRIITPIVLIVAIIACSLWYLLVYDREFTRDMLLTSARFSESQGNHKLSTWFYNRAYSQAKDNETVAIELAEQYKKVGNFTKAEYTLTNAISDGGGIELYIALCRTFIEQDKLRDAVLLLDNITNEDVKAQLEQMRPAAPTVSPDPGFYNQYISVTVEAETETIFAALDTEYPSTINDVYKAPMALKEGESTLCAVAVDDNGLVSTRAFFGYTIGGVVEKLEFADPVIEAQIRAFLNVSDKTVLYTKDLWNITEFIVPAEAKDYDDIKHMIYLESLTVENAIADELSVISGLNSLKTLKITNSSIQEETLSSIGALPKLTSLTLSNCSLSTIAPLSGLASLEVLDVSNNTIRNIDAIRSMEGLKELYLQQNALNDLSALSGLSGLTKLDVSHNSLETIQPVYTLKSLVWLNADNNSIGELGGIDALSGLTYLSLSANALSDVSKLSACIELTELYIADNSLTDITALNVLNKVTHLDFSHNQITAIPEFDKETALVTIDGSHNLIETLKPLSGLQNLNKVYMDYNEKISSVAELENCPRLVEVNVYATAVTDVTMLTNQSIIVNFNPVKDSDE